MEKEILIYSLGIIATLADYATTQIGLRVGLAETNPHVNPLLEGAFIIGGLALISELCRRFKVAYKLKFALMLVPVTIVFVIAVYNLTLIVNMLIKSNGGF